ncbi:3-keto-disaccharide hydrolase [Flectobacillus major]|jgi:hypothetical protein|uniref:3-keto-disaccharide hydrolase n=1 Tax=Flectobacillus major TaxID=103 RepID=UPI0005C76F58|nr:DUF1080 domain-containing protein [Flectobacillus major]
MKKILITTLCLVGSLTVLAQRKPQTADWKSLFNGKDLSGWDIKIAGQPLNDNYKNTFVVENGILRIKYDEYQNFDGKFGHLYYKKPYSYYKLRFQYRFVGKQTPGGAVWNERNSGVMLHSQSAQSLSFGQDFPVSLELQLLGGLNKGERHTGNLCTPGTQVYQKGGLLLDHCNDSNSKTYHGDQWVQAEAIVLGDSIIHHVIEGDTVLTYEHPEIGGGFVSKDYDFKAAHIDNGDEWLKKDKTPLKSGYIALQAESHPIDFRNIEILDLEGCMNPKALNYRPYFIKNNPEKCIFKKVKKATN